MLTTTTPTRTLTVNKDNWSGAETTVRITRITTKRVEFTVEGYDDRFVVYRGPMVAGMTEFTLTYDGGRPLATGYMFSDGEVSFEAHGIERNATGPNAVVRAATALICNIL